MYIVTLKFGENKAHAPKFMQAHNEWIEQGFSDGVFLLAGSVQPNQGGVLIVHNCSLEALEKRIGEDPFVKEAVVSASIMEITPARTAEQLQFLSTRLID